MAKYKKRPIIVDAEQWFPGKKIDGVEEHSYDNTIRTLDGIEYVRRGDWVIKNGDHLEVCTDEIFKETYELVMDEPIEVIASSQPKPIYKNAEETISNPKITRPTTPQPKSYRQRKSSNE